MTVRPTTQHDIQKDDENTTKPNFAVITNVQVTGTLSVIYSGIDPGTGNIQILSSGTFVVADTNSNDVFRCDSPGGAPGWTGTISGTPAGAIVSYTNVSGTSAALVPTSTSQLAKMRLYNITRGDYALISNASATPTAKITLTANAPAGWVNGDRITIASNTVVGGGFAWIDLELNSGPTSKPYLFLNLQFNSANVGDAVRVHPLETFASAKLISLNESVANQNVFMFGLIKVTANAFSFTWTGSPTASVIREAGYIG